MKFLAAKLDENGATTLAPEHGSPLRVRTRTGMIVPIDPCPDPCEPDSPVSLARLCLPRWAVDSAVGALAALDNERENLRGNSLLSGEGKKAEFVKAGANPGPLPRALRAITHVCKDFAEHERVTLRSEAERYKVPTVAPNSFEDVMRDHDIRNVVRSLTGEERTAVLNRLKDGDDPQLLLAVLRDPLLWRKPEVHELATSAWRDVRDRADPSGRAELDLKLATIEWAKRSLGHVAGSMRLMLSVDRNEPVDRGQVYELLRDDQSAAGKLSAAAELFSYSQREAANFELLIKRRAAA